MATQAPIIGQWYQDVALDEIFEVVAVDEMATTVEIQFLGGEVSEIDFESWQQMILIPAEPPEDFNASYEMSMEDEHQMDDIITPVSWDNPLAYIESDTIFGLDDF